MKTLAERMAWVVKKSGRTPSRLGLDAGLSPSQIGPIVRGKVGEGLALLTIRKIADEAGVSAGWLAFGEGVPSARMVGRYPALEAAIATRQRTLDAAASRARTLAETMPHLSEAGWGEVLDACERESAAPRAAAQSAVVPIGSRDAGPIEPASLGDAQKQLVEAAPPAQEAPRKRARRSS